MQLTLEKNAWLVRPLMSRWDTKPCGRAFRYERKSSRRCKENGLIEFGAHARIRTGDLFLTKWSSIPGEFDLILGPLVDFGQDHLPRGTFWYRETLGWIALGRQTLECRSCSIGPPLNGLRRFNQTT